MTEPGNLPELPAGRRITRPDPATLASICQAYESGATIRDIAARTGRSFGWVRRILLGADVPMRPRGLKSRPSTPGGTA